MNIQKGVRYMIAAEKRGWGHFSGWLVGTAVSDYHVTTTNKVSAKFRLDDGTIVQRSVNGIHDETQYNEQGQLISCVALTEERYKEQKVEHAAREAEVEALMTPFKAFAEMFNTHLSEKGITLQAPSTWQYLDQPFMQTPKVKDNIQVSVTFDYGTLKRIAPLLIHALAEQIEYSRNT